MKNRRLQFAYRRSASALHKIVGNCLRDGAFSNFKVYQEYPVNKVNPDFSSGREKFDWVILDLGIVIECHGKQHYEPVTFGGITKEEAKKRLQLQKEKDELKKQAALDAGFNYVVIPYTDESEVTEAYILKLVEEARESQPEIRRVLESSTETTTDWKSAYQKRKEWLEESGLAEERKQRAKEARRKQYELAKQWKKSQGGRSNE